MMEDKEKQSKATVNRVENFFAGKGFYIVLLLCVAVIGVSAWSMFTGGGTSDPLELSAPVSRLEDEALTTGKTESALVTEQAVPAPAVTAVPALTEPEEAAAAETANAEAEDATKGAAETAARESAPAASAAPEPAQSSAPAAVPGRLPEDPVPVSEPGPTYFIWPVSGTVENGYSMTALVFDRTMQDWRTHDGLDIAAEVGAQVRAAAAGTVSNCYYDERLGTTVVLNHGGGVESIYANLAGTPTVNTGDKVSVGQVIGAVGESALFEIGEVSHLHFAMTKDGQSIDPGAYLP